MPKALVNEHKSCLTATGHGFATPLIMMAAQSHHFSKCRTGMGPLSRIGSKMPKQLGRVRRARLFLHKIEDVVIAPRVVRR